MIGRQAMSSDFLMKRNSWIVVAVGTLFDIAFCFVVALIFSPREPGSAFLILLATVWGVGLLIHLKSKFVKTLIYYLGGRRQRIEATLDEFVRLRMPSGASYQNDASEYCRRVASDEDESKDARLLCWDNDRHPDCDAPIFSNRHPPIAFRRRKGAAKVLANDQSAARQNRIGRGGNSRIRETEYRI